MKRKNIFLSVLLSIFLLGIILTVTGIACGGRLYSFQAEKMINEKDYQNETTQLTEEEAAAIRGIDFKAQTGQLQIVSGDNFSISGDGYYKSYFDDGIWHIETAKYSTSLSILSHTIELPNFWKLGNGNHKNIISIPANVVFESANIQAAAGELNADLISSDYMSIKVGAGEIKIKELKAEDLTVKIGAGESVISKLNVSESCNAKIGTGELTLGDKKFPSGTNTIANLNGKCALGEMNISGKLTGDAELKVSTGQMDLLLDGQKSNYNISTESDLANINFKQQKDNLNENDSDVQNDDENDTNSNDGTSDAISSEENEHFGNLDLKCSLGEISVYFRP